MMESWSPRSRENLTLQMHGLVEYISNQEVRNRHRYYFPYEGFDFVLYLRAPLIETSQEMQKFEHKEL